MRTLCLRLFLCALLPAFLAGCGTDNAGNNGFHGGTGGGSGSSTVTFTFIDGTPTAAATQTGGGAFASATIQAGELAVSVPSGTTNYSVAYVCPTVTGLGTNEFVIEAALKDGSSFTVSCLEPPGPTTGAFVGTVDAALIPNAADVLIRGSQNLGGDVGANNGFFNVNLPTGTEDVALVAVDSATPPDVLAVQILRSQTVPGGINGGAAAIFGSLDQITSEPLTINNIPSGFVTPPAVAVTYFTANGTSFLLDNNSATQYPAVPSGATQSGDFYSFEANTSDTATHNSSVGITQNTTNGATGQTVSLPAPWSFSGPVPATLPTFTFNYSGFAGLAAVAQQAKIQWVSSAVSNSITVIATANFQSGTNTITIPNLTSLSGFLASAPSGTAINWVADIFGGTVQEFAFFAGSSPNGSVSFVQNRGTFTQP